MKKEAGRVADDSPWARAAQPCHGQRLNRRGCLPTSEATARTAAQAFQGGGGGRRRGLSLHAHKFTLISCPPKARRAQSKELIVVEQCQQLGSLRVRRAHNLAQQPLNGALGLNLADFDSGSVIMR